MKTYEQIHSGLHWDRGQASLQQCVVCGARASDWAYLYTSQKEVVDHKNRRYSECFDDYAPMCRSCHRRFDMTRPERKEAQQAHLCRINEEARKDPGYSEIMRERGLKGVAVLREKRARGEHLGGRSDEGLKELGRKLGALRRRCGECEMETVAGPLASHQRASGHRGYEEVKP